MHLRSGISVRRAAAQARRSIVWARNAACAFPLSRRERAPLETPSRKGESEQAKPATQIH